MNIEEINEIIKEEGKVIFSPEPEGLYYIWLENDKITFTSGTNDYLGELEDVIEELFKKFRIWKFEILVHFHRGEKHDKDINFIVDDRKIISEIIKFIMDNFYSNKDWDYEIVKGGNKNEKDKIEY